ncbi:MAG: sigma-70 family RNA polymerase sigma factor [Planctomycetaceae bacterium]|nr:sigma-70 family RNA polymerase sigma factor [Planctomycetaceae bacterium]
MSVVETRESEPELRLVALLQDARQGSNCSLGQLLQAYRDYLSLLADEELGSDIKVKASVSDLVQESFLEAKRDFGQFKGTSPQDFQAWLRRLLLNNVANVIRSYRGTGKRDVSREVAYFDGEYRKHLFAGEQQSPSSMVVKNERFDALAAAMKRLPEHYQEIIQCRNYERLSFDDIGKRMGRSAEAARKLWARAVELLQQELDEIDDTITRGSGNAVQ